MCVRERGSSSGKLIDVRRERIGMTSHIADPIVLIIDRDHEDVRFVSSRGD